MRLFNRGFTLIAVIITVSIVALLAAIGIPQLIRSRMQANESSARATLRTISTACENYANDHQGTYPTAIGDLTGATPPYMNEDYIAISPFRGYNFTCSSLDTTGYSCSAQPQDCGQSGSKSYTITTSAVLTEADCGA